MRTDVRDTTYSDHDFPSLISSPLTQIHILEIPTANNILIFLVIRKMQIQITLGFHLILTIRTITKLTMPTHVKIQSKARTHQLLVGVQICTDSLEISMQFFRYLKMDHLQDLTLPFLPYILRNIPFSTQTLGHHVHWWAIHKIQKFKPV